MSLKNLSVTIKIPKIFIEKLKNKKINLIYKNFEKNLNVNDKFAVAVSGGPDSLALAFLAKYYSIKNKIHSKFFIVDHQLRPESTMEAKLVKKVLKQYYINAKILTWKGKKPFKNIQSVARGKRYELLFSECDKYNINNILLGHHQDDLIENFFIRLLRGSGLKGLISLGKKNLIDDKILLRPLLGQKKERLIFISKNIFNYYVKDPSNDDEKYLRIKIRKLINGMKKNGLDNEKLIKTLNNLKHSNKVVDYYVNENLQNNSFYSLKKNKLSLNKNFFEHPYEVIFRAFSSAIKLVGGKYYSVRGKKLDRIITNIKDNSLTRTTLGGCIVEKVNQTVILTKEH